MWEKPLTNYILLFDPSSAEDFETISYIHYGIAAILLALGIFMILRRIMQKEMITPVSVANIIAGVIFFGLGNYIGGYTEGGVDRLHEVPAIADDDGTHIFAIITVLMAAIVCMLTVSIFRKDRAAKSLDTEDGTHITFVENTAHS